MEKKKWNVSISSLVGREINISLQNLYVYVEEGHTEDKGIQAFVRQVLIY